MTFCPSLLTHLVKVPGVVVARHLKDEGRHALADVGKGPLLVLEKRVSLHRIRTVKPQPGGPVIDNLEMIDNSGLHRHNLLTSAYAFIGQLA